VVEEVRERPEVDVEQVARAEREPRPEQDPVLVLQAADVDAMPVEERALAARNKA